MSVFDDLSTLLIVAGAPLATVNYQLATDPQTLALPKVIFTLPEEKRQYTNDGDAGVAYPFIQMDVVAATMASARAIAKAIRVALKTMPQTSGSTTIRCAVCENRKEMAEPTEAGREKPSQKVIMAWRMTIDDPT